MVVFSFYPSDSRVRREAEALADTGMSVDVICLKHKHEARNEIVRGINTHRINLLHKRGSKLRYLIEYGYFFIRAFLKLSLLHLSKDYDIVHVHNMPDILVACAFLPKLMGSKIVLDLHDPMPELYITKYSVSRFHPITNLIKFFEKISIRFADIVLTPNKSFRNLFITRSCPSSKIHIIMNSPAENIFQKGNSKNTFDRQINHEKFNLMYHGTIVERSGLDTAIKAIVSAKEKIPNLMLNIFGDGEFCGTARRLVDEFSLKENVKFYGWIPLENISEVIQLIDVGIIPNKLNPFTSLNLPVRIFEYLILGKPVIVPRTQGILDYFDEASLYFFESENIQSLDKEILTVFSDKQTHSLRVERGAEVCHKYRWSSERQRLVNLMQQLPDV